MRRAVIMMSLRLSASCTSPGGQAQALHSKPTWAAGLRVLQPRGTACFDGTTRLHSKSVARDAGCGSLAQKSQRAIQTRAYNAQYNNASVAVDEYIVQSMPWDPMAANAVSLIGNTGKDVEIKRLETGRVVGNLTLACTHKAGQTTWYDIDIWGPMAERIAEQVSKGSSICVQGKLTPRVWTNREGKQQTKFAISASEVRFVQRDQPPAGQQQQGGWNSQGQTQQAWGAQPSSNAFEQAPPAGAEWGNANNVVPSQQPQAPAGYVTKESSAEEKWRSVIENPGLWWNNSQNKRNPKAPDFKLKSDPTGSVALWITSRDTPDWARQKLESAGITPTYQPSGFTDMN